MKPNIKKIVIIATVAALYALLTYLSAAFGLAYGAVQFRLSEALMILAVFSPEAVWGLGLGCILGNIASPLGIADILCGALATVLAALCIRLISSKVDNDLVKCFAVAAFTALFNAVIIGSEIVIIMIPDKATWSLFLLNALQIAIGELCVCLALSYPIMQTIKNNKYLSRFFNTKKETQK
ncbi:MAG: QueT transporter family protein [Clostridia bacterium]|nr:QueT transporter family protein [Clostridia bacterium]